MKRRWLRHQVLIGETLASVARTYGLTENALLRLNMKQYPGLRHDPDFLAVGWVLVLR
jgi:LysM repeat protein